MSRLNKLCILSLEEAGQVRGAEGCSTPEVCDVVFGRGQKAFADTVRTTELNDVFGLNDTFGGLLVEVWCFWWHDFLILMYVPRRELLQTDRYRAGANHNRSWWLDRP